MTANDIRYGRQGGRLVRSVKRNPNWDSVPASCGCGANRTTAFVHRIGLICSVCSQIIRKR